MYSFIVFKYVNLILWKDYWGETELILRIWGAKKKYFQGAEVLSFKDLGR